MQECKLMICAIIAEDLIQSELAKPRDQQSLHNFNLYINLIVTLAQREPFIDRQFKTIFLCATNMEVLSGYYYLVSNILRLKVS